MVDAGDKFQALDDVWTDPCWWRNIVKGGWACHNAIHLKEARVALMQLRRAARCPAVHGMRLLGLADNLSALLAFMKGRARDSWLRLLVRQAAAIAIGAEIAWHLRYIESARNCTDYDSRAADRGEVGPGQAILGAARACRRALDSAADSRPAPPSVLGGRRRPCPSPPPRRARSCTCTRCCSGARPPTRPPGAWTSGPRGPAPGDRPRPPRRLPPVGSTTVSDAVGGSSGVSSASPSGRALPRARRQASGLLRVLQLLGGAGSRRGGARQRRRLPSRSPAPGGACQSVPLLSAYIALALLFVASWRCILEPADSRRPSWAAGPARCLRWAAGGPP